MNKRQSQRLNTSVPILIKVVESPEAALLKQTCKAITVDISEHGLRVISDKPLCQGAIVSLWVQSILPDVPSYTLSGEVIRVHLAPLKSGFCYGIKLFPYKNDDFRRWKHWLMRMS